MTVTWPWRATFVWCAGWFGHQAGARNVDTALAKLGELGIPVINKDVGGTKGRRVEFHTRDGSVYVKRI